MKLLKDYTTEQLLEFEAAAQKRYDEIAAEKITLNMARGKPAPEQLDLVMGMLDCLSSKDLCRSEDGTDCRNYGIYDGLPEMKQMFADILEVKPSNIIIFGRIIMEIF